MTHGLAKAGLQVLGGVDNDPSCKETYERNNAPAVFLEADVTQLQFEQFSEHFGLKKEDDKLVLSGCSPCQFWSKINTDRTQSEKTAFLLREFRKFVEWFRPGFVIIENVPGLFSRRGESALPQFLRVLEREGYSYAHDVVNALRYGVPQNRRRYLLIASRVSEKVTLPAGRDDTNLRVRSFLGETNGFPKIEAGHFDSTMRLHSAAGLSPQNLQRIRRTAANGGDRMAWKNDESLQIDAYRGRDDIFRDVYARMSWDRPAPTITTRFNSFSNGRFGHPEEDRAISLREGATLQTFPKSYRFLAANQATIARHIGNAVPPALAEHIGRHLVKLHYGKV